MAECYGGVCPTSNYQYSGGQGGWGGSGKPEEYWQEQADLLRNWAGNPETLTMAKTHQLAMLGPTRYRSLYPEVYHTFGPTGSMLPRFWDEKQRIANLRQLQMEYSGPEGAMIRWLIGNRVKTLEYDLAKRYARSEVRQPEYEEAPPIPSWMEPYVETRTVPVKEGPGKSSRRRGGEKTKEIKVLRPLGAQTELTPDQMAYMAGYEAWQKSGMPTQYSQNALLGMSQLERYWQPHTTLSQSLFPRQQTQTPRWAIARQ